MLRNQQGKQAGKRDMHSEESVFFFCLMPIATSHYSYEVDIDATVSPVCFPFFSIQSSTIPLTTSRHALQSRAASEDSRSLSATRLRGQPFSLPEARNPRPTVLQKCRWFVCICVGVCCYNHVSWKSRSFFVLAARRQAPSRTGIQ
jgi:hypothetical protein